MFRRSINGVILTCSIISVWMLHKWIKVLMFDVNQDRNLAVASLSLVRTNIGHRGEAAINRS